MSKLTDLVARAGLALVELDERIYRVTVELEDKDRSVAQTVTCLRCEHDDHPIHVRVDSSRLWDKRRSDAETFGSPPDVSLSE